MLFYHMLVMEKNLVCWENRCSLLWDFTGRNLVDSPVTSTVSFEDSADINGTKDAKPRSSLYYNIILQWGVYILKKKTFTDFPLLLQLCEWTRGQSKEFPNRHWLPSDIEKCVLPYGGGSDEGHRASGSVQRFVLCTSGGWLLTTDKCPDPSDITVSQQATKFSVVRLVYKVLNRYFFF